MQQRTYHVYIMSSRSRTLYIGVTGLLMARILRHKKGEGGEFTREYGIHRLVYFQSFHNIGDAIARETQLKKWRREKKVALIEERNPTWEDLAEGWGEPTPMRIKQPQTAPTNQSEPKLQPSNQKPLVIPTSDRRER